MGDDPRRGTPSQSYRVVRRHSGTSATPPRPGLSSTSLINQKVCETFGCPCSIPAIRGLALLIFSVSGPKTWTQRHHSPWH